MKFSKMIKTIHSKIIFKIFGNFARRKNDTFRINNHLNDYFEWN